MPIFRPIWPPSGSKNCLPSKINLNFLRFFHTFLRKRARRCQLRRVISRQPLRIETKGSPFWKVDKQGFNIRLKPRKSIIWPWTPPHRVNCVHILCFPSLFSSVTLTSYHHTIGSLCFDHKIYMNNNRDIYPCKINLTWALYRVSQKKLGIFLWV